MKTKFSKLTAWLWCIAVLMTLMLGVTAYAQGSTTVTVGDFTIAPTDGITQLTEGTDYSYDEGTLSVFGTVPVTVGMADGVTTTAETVIISAEADTEITFDSINISTDKESCIEVINSANTTIVFTGESEVASSHKYGRGIGASATENDAVLHITSKDSGSISMTSGQYGAFFDSYPCGQGFEVSGNLNLDITGCASHAIYNMAGYVKISGTPVINLDATKYGIYGLGIELSGGTFKLKNDDGYIICSATGLPITISNNADIHIIDADRGIRTENGKITITDSAQLKVFGGDEDNRTTGILDYVISSGELLIEDNVVIDIFSQESAISGGVTTIRDNAKVYIDIECESTYSRNAIAFDTTLDIGNNVIIDINVIKGAKVYGLYDLNGTVNISDSAVVTVNGAYRSVYADYLNLSGKSNLTITNDINRAFYGETLTIKDYATITASAPSDRVVYGDVVVIPATGTTYTVTTGASEAEATVLGTYTQESSFSAKSSWRYFKAVPDSIPEASVLVTTSDVKVENLTGSAVLIVTSFIGDKLNDTKIIPVTGDCKKTLLETGLNTTGADSVKAFLWKDISDIEPICSSDDTSL